MQRFKVCISLHRPVLLFPIQDKCVNVKNVVIFNPQLLLYFDRNNRSIFIISCLHIILRFDDSICPFMGIIINYLGRKLKKLKYIFEIVKLFRKDFIKICLQVLIHFVYVILLKSYFLFQIKSATYLVEIFNL